MRPTCTPMSSTRGDGLARGVLVGDGPAGRLGREAELALLGDGVHLHHHAVDLVGQAVAPALPLPRRMPAPPRRVRALAAVRIHLEAHGGEGVERFPVAVETRSGRPPAGNSEKKSRRREAVMVGSSTRSEPAAALRGLAKRESPRSSRSALSRSKARRFMTVSPRASKPASGVFDAEGQGTDGARVFGDVFAHAAVAARDPPARRRRRGSARPWRGRRASARRRSRRAALPSRSRTRRSKSRSSPSLSALSRLSMGELWGTLTKPSRGLPPTRWLGESGVTSRGAALRAGAAAA